MLVQRLESPQRNLGFKSTLKIDHSVINIDVSKKLYEEKV
jgi:hypothetical protein